MHPTEPASPGQAPSEKDDILRRLRAERDAALAVAFYAGKSLTSLDEDSVYRMVGAAFEAWLRPDHDDKFQARRPNIARIRREAGLEERS